MWSCRCKFAGVSAGSKADFTAGQVAWARAEKTKTAGDVGAGEDRAAPVGRMQKTYLHDAASTLAKEELSLGVFLKFCKLVTRAIRMSDLPSALYRKHGDKMMPPPKMKINTASPTRFSSPLNSLQFIVENKRVLRDMVHDSSRIWEMLLFMEEL